MKGINQFMLYEKAVKGLLLVLKQMILESEGGVYIEGLGYFFNYIDLKKTKWKKNGTKIKHLRKIYVYRPHFHPDPQLEKWCMDRTFHYNMLIKIVRKRGRVGRKYKFHLSLIKALQQQKQLLRRD